MKILLTFVVEKIQLRMILNKKLEMLLKTMLPIVFVSYFCCITFFTHSHVINGVTIVHSHPYKADTNGDTSHEHSGTELQLINALSVFYAAGAIIPFILLALLGKPQKMNFAGIVYPAYARRIEPHHKLRPPPAL